MSVLRLEQIRASDVALAGGKGANLGELVAQGFPVPPGFVVSAPAFRDLCDRLSLAPHIAALEQAPRSQLPHLCEQLQQRIVAAPLPPDLSAAILQAHADLTRGRDSDLTWAVRSSATAEDQAGASFAGQHGTYYYVTADRLLEMVRHCWASLWTPEAVSYRATHGIPHRGVLMAVVIQEMVRSDVSGIAFTANPVTGERNELVIEASWGMGAAIVDGRVTPDRFVLGRPGLDLREGRIAEKRFMVPTQVPARRSQRIVAVPHELQRRETLGPEQVRAVADWALRCESHFGRPQDVEWAMADGRFWLLQSRPVTTLSGEAAFPAPAGKWVLFKPLVENFTDPLTPLVVDLVSLVRPPGGGLEFIGGRLYQDLRLIAPVLPFRATDRELVDLLYLAESGSRPPLTVSWLKLPLTALAAAALYLPMAVLLTRSRHVPDDFMSSYRRLCRRVVDDPAFDPVTAIRRLFLFPSLLDPVGDMPLLVNLGSFRSVFWMGLLRTLLRRWVPDAPPDAVAQLCAGTDGVLSADMGREIARLARVAQGTPAVREILLQHHPDQSLAQLRREPAAGEFLEQLDAFLAVHGHRAHKEFELSVPRWAEHPAPVLGMIRNYLHATGAGTVPTDTAAHRRSALEEQVRATIGTGYRWRLLRFLAGRARYFLKQRENSRFYHIMGFGAIRQKILALEAELLHQGRLKCKDDIFFLLWREVEGLRSGRLAWADVEGVVRERRLAHVRLAKLTPPRTIGIALPPEPRAADAATELAGQGASPGRYQGTARVILDPSVDATLNPGEVLVAPYTDPAWTPMFLTAGAAVVEIGSYLSHAGTVAREFGMPCVVDVPDCTRRIRTGMRVEVDGTSGVVRILDQAAGG